MARHRSTPSDLAPRLRRGRRATLVAGTVALLTAGAGLVLPSAWADPSSGPGVCEEGVIPLADVTVTVNGESYEATWLVDHFQDVPAALAPLDEVTVTYDPDDALGTPDVPADDCTRGFQLEAFAAEGPTFATSGDQTWQGGDGATMSADQPVVTLGVAVPECFYQTDLSSQGATFEPTDYFDGHDADHPLPHYPDVPTPYGLIAGSGGGEGCVLDEVTPAAPEVRESCSSEGIAIQVTLDEDLAWSYTLDGGAPVVVDRARTIVPVEEDAAYAVVVTATPVGGATVPVGAQTEWTFSGVRDCFEEVPSVTPQAPTAALDCSQDGALVVTVVPDADLTWSYSLDGGAPVEITGTTASATVVEDAAYSVVVTAAAVGGATVPVGAQTEWTFTGVRDCAQVEDSVTVPPSANAPVRGAVEADALAVTGADPRTGLLAGILLLLGGAGLVLLTRRAA